MASSKNNTKPPVRHSDPDKTGDLSAARRAATASSDEKGKAAAKPTRRPARGSDVAAREKKERRAARKREQRAGRGSAPAPAGSSRRPAKARAATTGGSRDTQRAAMRFASDNRAVQLFYGLTTGPRRYLFYLAVALFVGVGVYFPVRDFYIAVRTEAILKEQNEIRDTYNEALGDEVESLLSEEGVSDVARRDYGMVMPGEKTITVEGLDEEGNPVIVDEGQQAAEGDQAAEGQDAPAGAPDATSSQGPSSANGAASKDDQGKLKGEDAADKSKTGSSGSTDATGDSEPTTSAEVEKAERAVFENSPWYWKVLDALFLFDGVNGMAVVSTGE